MYATSAVMDSVRKAQQQNAEALLAKVSHVTSEKHTTVSSFSPEILFKKANHLDDLTVKPKTFVIKIDLGLKGKKKKEE